MWGILQRYRRLWWVGAALVLLLLVWFFFFLRSSGSAYQTLVVHPSTFAQMVSVSGTVAAAQNSDLGFAQSGRLAHVYVGVGDAVGEGQLIAEMENGDARALVASKEAILAQEEANLDALRAGTRPEEVAVSQAQVTSDEAALAQANQALLNALQNAYTVSDSAVHNTADQFFSNARTTNPQLTFTTTDSTLQNRLVSERVSAEMLLASWQSATLALSGSSDLTSPAAQSLANLNTIATFLTDANAALNGAIANSAVSSADLAAYITAVSTARTAVNTALASLTSATTAQKSAATALNKDSKSLALAQAGSTPQAIAAAQAQVAAAQADVDNARAALQKTQIVAPFSGIITRMDAKVGEIVSPNTSEISMQSNGAFEIDCYIPEVSIAQVSVGNVATATLDAYGPSTYFGAKVTSIDPAQTQQGGVSTYKTVLVFTRPDDRIRTGMTASVEIETAMLPNALVVPSGAVFEVGTEPRRSARG